MAYEYTDENGTIYHRSGNVTWRITPAGLVRVPTEIEPRASWWRRLLAWVRSWL